MTARPLETPVPPADLAVGGTGSIPGPTVNQLRDVRFCRHGWYSAGCIFCEDPVLEHEQYLRDVALLREHGDLR